MSDNIMQTDGEFNSQETLESDTSEVDDILGILEKTGAFTGDSIGKVYNKPSVSAPVSKPPSKEYGDSIKANVQEEKSVNNTTSSSGSASENTSGSEFAEYVILMRKSFPGYDNALKDLQTAYDQRRSVNYAAESKEDLGKIQYLLEDKMSYCRGQRDSIENMMTSLDSEERVPVGDDYKLKDDFRKELKAYLSDFNDIHDKLSQVVMSIKNAVADKSGASSSDMSEDTSDAETGTYEDDGSYNDIPDEGDYTSEGDYDDEGEGEDDSDDGISDDAFSVEELSAAGEGLELGDDDDSFPFQNIDSKSEETPPEKEEQKPVENFVEEPGAIKESGTKESEAIRPYKRKNNTKLRANLINIDLGGRERLKSEYAASLRGLSKDEIMSRGLNMQELAQKPTVSSDVNSYVVKLIKMRFATHINTLEDDALRAKILESFQTHCNASCVEKLPNGPFINAYMLYTLQLSGFNVLDSDIISDSGAKDTGALTKSAKVIFQGMYKSEFDISGDGFLRMANVMSSLDEEIDSMLENVKEGNQRSDKLTLLLRKIDIKLSWLCALNEHAAETEFDVNTNDFRGGKFMMKNIDQFVGYFNALENQTKNFYSNTARKAARH